MAKQKGRLMLVKMSNGADPAVWLTVCGLRSKTLTINNNAYDVTTADETDPGGPLWREVQNGISSMSISGNGLIRDDNVETRLTNTALDGDGVGEFRVNVPSLGTFEGDFHIDTLEFGGELEAGTGISLSLSSTGRIDFEAT